jgi:hypothetical protein
MELKDHERRRQIEHEISWLKEKLKTVKKQKHRKDLERQIKEREYNLDLGILTPNQKK